MVNAGIGGNQVVGPGGIRAAQAVPRRPVAPTRLERDVLEPLGRDAVIWLEGINDFSKNGNASAEAVQDGMKEVVAALRAEDPGLRIFGATVTTALGARSAAHGFAGAGREAQGAERVHPHARACSTAWPTSTRRRSIPRPAG